MTYPRPPVAVGHTEPCPRRVRARLGGRVVIDTTRAVYLWEWPFYPRWCLPADDVDPDLLAVAQRPDGDAADAALAGTVTVAWDAVDAWFEEDEQVHVHPRNPYTRVDAVRARRHVRVSLDGVLLADSDAPVLLFETGLPTRYYLDPTAVETRVLEPTDTVTACPYKGVTSGWWSVRTPSGLHPDLAWRYDHPDPAVARIAGLVAFFDERVDVEVDGVPRPRPRTHFA